MNYLTVSFMKLRFNQNLLNKVGHYNSLLVNGIYLTQSNDF